MNRKIYNLVCAALCLALCIVLPFLTGQIPEMGQLLSPMHLPVFICGFVCGWEYGLAVGLIAPLLRSVTCGMPPLFPTAVSMAVELAVYGLMTAVLYAKLPKKVGYIYVSLICAMIAGRAAGGAFKFLLLGLGYINKFTFGIFVTSYITKTIPGIISQIVIVPPVVMLLEKIRPGVKTGAGAD